jgi:hypothetical protein
MTSFDGALRRYATPVTTVLSVVVAVTGVILFFHLAKEPAETIHEWLGMAFAVAAILHVVRHRGSFAQLLRQRHVQALAAATAAGVAAFVVLVPPKPPGNPMVRVALAAQHATIAHLAPAVGTSTERALVRLEQAGIKAGPGDTVAVLASTHRKHPAEVFAALLPPQPQFIPR